MSHGTERTGLRSRKARRAAERARLRASKRPIADAGKEAYRCVCPWCHADNVVMSALVPTRPTATPPDIGDVIQCDYCRRYHGVFHISGFKVLTAKVELDR